jgi:hypothetical protein
MLSKNYVEDLKQLASIRLFSLVQGNKLNLFWLESFISEWTSDGIKIVSSERNQSSSAA